MQKDFKLNRDKYLGSLLGLAIGDAFGAPIEFCLPGTFKEISHFTGGGYFKLKPGEWTDDTALTICTAKSLIRCRGFNPDDQLSDYLAWYRNGRNSTRKEAFGVGLVTAAALMRFESTHESYCGPIGSKTAANGSIMHLAPVPLLYARKPKEAIKKAAQCSQLTHGAQDAVDCCRFLAALICGTLRGFSKEELLAQSFFTKLAGSSKEHHLAPAVSQIVKGSFKTKRKPKITEKNYSDAVTTLQAALWAFYHTDTFEEGLIKVVKLGWDADTMGAVYGQIAGCFYGYENIPKELTRKVFKSKELKKIAEQLYLLAGE